MRPGDSILIGRTGNDKMTVAVGGRIVCLSPDEADRIAAALTDAAAKARAWDAKLRAAYLAARQGKPAKEGA